MIQCNRHVCNKQFNGVIGDSYYLHSFTCSVGLSERTRMFNDELLIRWKGKSQTEKDTGFLLHQYTCTCNIHVIFL